MRERKPAFDYKLDELMLGSSNEIIIEKPSPLSGFMPLLSQATTLFVMWKKIANRQSVGTHELPAAHTICHTEEGRGNF